MEDTQIQHELAVRDQLIVEVQPIKTDEDRQQANAMRVKAKDWLAHFEVIEQGICSPIYQAWKNAKDRFKQGRAPAEAFVAAIDKVLRDDRILQEAERAREQKRLNDLAQKRFDRAQAAGKATPFVVPVAPIVQDMGRKVETGDGTKVTWVANYTAEVYDASKLPPEYLMPDMTKLNAAAKAKLKEPAGARWVNNPYQKVTR